MTIDVARLRELHQPMYGHTGDPCSWCREWTPCPVTELLDAYEERDRLRDENERAAQLAIEATHLILRLREERDRLRATLEFYADPDTYKATPSGSQNSWGNYEVIDYPIGDDEGEIARAALEGRE